MKQLTTITVCVTIMLLTILAGIVLAQTDQPYRFWPDVYSLAGDVYVTRGVDESGAPDGNLYLRFNWGECLRINRRGLDDMYWSVPVDRYVRARDYADSVYDPVWTDHDRANCPTEPQAVKATWYGSRPVYEWVQVDGVWMRGDRTAYRVRPGQPCAQYRLPRSNYWSLSPVAEVYHADTGDVFRVEELAYQYPPLAVCEGTGADILQYRFGGG